MEFSSDMLHRDQDGDMERDNEIDVSEVERTSEQNFLQAFTKHVLLFSLKAKEQCVLPKATLSALMNDIAQLISESHNEFCEQVIRASSKNGIDTSNAHELNKLLRF